MFSIRRCTNASRYGARPVMQFSTAPWFYSGIARAKDFCTPIPGEQGTAMATYADRFNTADLVFKKSRHVFLMIAGANVVIELKGVAHEDAAGDLIGRTRYHPKCVYEIWSTLPLRGPSLPPKTKNCTITKIKHASEIHIAASGVWAAWAFAHSSAC